MGQPLTAGDKMNLLVGSIDTSLKHERVRRP
jgi:hypothetical protein